MKAGSWTAIVLAGERPRESHFAQSHGAPVKALIPVGGEPMLGRVVRTLHACPSVGGIVILAQQPRQLQDAIGWIEAEPRVSFAESGSGIATSIAAHAGSAQA